MSSLDPLVLPEAVEKGGNMESNGQTKNPDNLRRVTIF